MADSIERTIYKLELDSSGYINGVEAVSASTKRLTDAQERANKALQTNEAALKNNTANLAKTKKDLDDYTGANERYRKQLEKSFKDASANQIKLTQLVAENRKEYERAETAAKNFANVSARATTLQQGTTGGKIPTGPPIGLRSPIQPIVDKVSENALIELLDNTTDEFGQLEIAIQIAEERMQSLNQEGEEFKLLAPIVASAKKALQELGDAANKTAGSQGSLKTQLTQGRNELVRLEQAGKSNTKQYKELEIQVAKLTDAYGDQQDRIKVLSSDTRALDFGKAAVQSAISGFQAYSAVMILVGGENEKLQKRTMELFAAMQLLTALEQLSNTVKRGGVLATNAQSAAQAVYTAVVGASTGALRAFRIAMLATGIGAAVVAIGFLVSKLSQAKKELDEAGKKQKQFNDILAEGKDEYVKAVVEVDNLKIAFREAREGVITKEQAVKLYNDTIGKTTGSVKSLDEAEKALGKNADAYIRFTLLKAAANTALNRAAQLAFDAALKQQETVGKTFDDDPQGLKAARAGAKASTEADRLKKDRDVVLDIQKDFQSQYEKIAKEFNFDILGLSDIKSGANKKDKIENVFIKSLNDLLKRLRGASSKEIESVDFIQDEFTDKLVSEIDKIDELVAKKQLTSGQGNILVKILEAVIGKESDAAVQLLKDRIKTAIDKLQDELKDLDIKRAQDSVSLLQDEFEKRAAQIDLSEKQEIDAITESNKERLATLEELNASGAILEKDYVETKKRIILGGELDILNIIRKAAQDRQALSADILKDALDAVEAEGMAGLGEGVEGGKPPKKKPPKEPFQDYAVAIGELTQSVIQFWQQANDAESAALDRSIALQEKRVEAAQRIAARGNAQYLKQEEDRLKAMQVQKENAARRELAINAALQASQLLVGITGAISKIATPGIGIAETIGAIAVIFASLATGYGLVKSLQGSQPKLAAGTKSVRRNGHPSGTDTIPALLNEGEAVIPTHRNRAYHPAVAAIYDGSIPAADMNRFVNNYHKIKGVPQPNYSKIKDAAEMSIGYDGRLLEELKENNNLQRQTLRAMKNMSVSANIDRNGVAIMVNEFMIQQEIDKRV